MNEILIWTSLGFGLFIFSLAINLLNTYRNVQDQKITGNTIDSPIMFFLTNIPIIAIMFTDGFIVAIISFVLVWFISTIIMVKFFM